MSSPLPVTVVTGFLGAGKTTLVNAWLAGFARGEVAVIVNELGDVGIDGELLAARARTIVEITGGCVCCASQAELVRALDELGSSSAPPQRVLIETSGAASPAGVLRAIALGGPGGAFVLDGVITVVDAARVDAVCRHDLAIEQVGYADVVVLSRTDVCDARALAHARELIAAHNGAAVVLEGTRGVLPAAASLGELLALRRMDLAEPRELPQLETHGVYESVSLSLAGDLDGDRFAEFVESEIAPFAGRLFRTKGILAIAGLDERMLLQGVADAVEITFGEPWGDTPRRSRLVVVGFALDRDALRRGFAACAGAPT
ncbi:MAG: GTP-binding protein [Deltaproteobacteria bacterium]|nr:GTP-binding protein [Nannocystaceae bacterium]